MAVCGGVRDAARQRPRRLAGPCPHRTGARSGSRQRSANCGIVACLLVGFGLYRLWRHSHPKFVGMRVGFRDLTLWSFLMASAHGAGLMLLPFVINMSDHVFASAGSNLHHSAVMTNTAVPWVGALALGLHTAAYLLVLAGVAWIVYRKLGLELLRTAWLNLDLIWSCALVGT